MTILVLLSTNSASAIDSGRKIPFADSLPFLGLEELSRNLRKAVCAIQIPAEQTKGNLIKWNSIGTGFFVDYEHRDTLVVTCKHIVNLSYKLQKQIYIGLDTEKGYKRFVCNVVYIDPLHDIAILNPRKEDKDDSKFKFATFDKELFDDDASLVEGRSVIIPGYPLSLGIEDDQNHPVIRFGFVAQFTGKDYFLLDGVASHGNSGSPVFSVKSDNNKLIGMAFGFQSDNINLFDEEGKLSASLPYNSGLAKCVTMKAIMTAIKNVKL